MTITTTTIKTIHRDSRTTATKGNSLTTMILRYSVNSVLDPGEIFQIFKLLDEHADNPNHYKEVKSVKSTAEFVKNRNSNSAHINEIELESLAELMDHPIEHFIHEINMFVFSEAEETNEPQQ